MTCFYPLQAYYGERRSNGKNSVVFDSRLSNSSVELKLPCGQCVGCRLERSRVWAMRCLHESQLHDFSSFVTLTYDECPSDGSLNYWHFQKFMKRLRKRFIGLSPVVNAEGEEEFPIRFFHCVS